MICSVRPNSGICRRVQTSLRNGSHHALQWGDNSTDTEWAHTDPDFGHTYSTLHRKLGGYDSGGGLSDL